MLVFGVNDVDDNEEIFDDDNFDTE